MRVTKRRLLVIAVLLFAGMSQSHAQRDANYVHKDREILSTGEKMVLDAVVLRPIGMATTVVGSAVYVISLPFSLLGGNEAEVREHLVNEPARYTFKRPLGDVEY